MNQKKLKKEGKDIYYKNKKTGKIYIVMHIEAINTTNKNDGEIMILYQEVIYEKIDDIINNLKIFAREKKEFYEKFEQISL